tara:strand:- start:788 stop:970 length:183 start_codon:yes stop_codon:yes gene_type:complete
MPQKATRVTVCIATDSQSVLGLVLKKTKKGREGGEVRGMTVIKLIIISPATLSIFESIYI